MTHYRSCSSWKIKILKKFKLKFFSKITKKICENIWSFKQKRPIFFFFQNMKTVQFFFKYCIFWCSNMSMSIMNEKSKYKHYLNENSKDFHVYFLKIISTFRNSKIKVVSNQLSLSFWIWITKVGTKNMTTLFIGTIKYFQNLKQKNYLKVFYYYKNNQYFSICFKKYQVEYTWFFVESTKLYSQFVNNSNDLGYKFMIF